MPWFLHLVLGLCLMLTPAVSVAVTNQSKVPVFNYHPRFLTPPCDYTGSDLRMLETDLQTLHDEGFRVVPLYWITQWLRGEKDGSELPPWIVGITLDDAFEADWRDDVFAGVNPPHPCPAGYGKSAYSILRAYWDKYKDILPPGSPHASSFVIASPAARTAIDDFNVPPQFGGPGNQSHRDYWWAAAQNSGFMEVYNHSADHDDDTIQGGASPVLDYGFLENGQAVSLPIGGPNSQGFGMAWRISRASTRIRKQPCKWLKPPGSFRGESAFIQTSLLTPRACTVSTCGPCTFRISNTNTTLRLLGAHFV